MALIVRMGEKIRLNLVKYGDVMSGYLEILIQKINLSSDE